MDIEGVEKIGERRSGGERGSDGVRSDGDRGR